jgi:tetratricopeptide (TPR) repeat protein
MDDPTDDFQLALALHRQGQLAQARKLYGQILARQPKHFAALHLAGVAAGQMGDFAASAHLIGEAIDINPHNAAAHNNRGSAFKELGQWDAALASFERAIAIDPGYAEAHSNRGVVQSRLGRLEAAVASYDRALALKPDYADALYNRGNAQQALGQFQAALASYERAIAVNPGAANAHYNRANLQRRLGELDAALASYDRAIAAWPDHLDAHCNRGSVLDELRRFEAALASFDRCIAMKPDHAPAHANRGKVLIELQRFEEALQSCDRAIQLQPDFADAWVGRGAALKELRRWDEALASYDRAIQLQPTAAEAHANRGVLFYELNRVPAALDSYDCAIAADPHFARARFYKSMAMLLAGDYENGWREYEWRWRSEPGARRALLRTDVPAWDGTTAIDGRTILLHCEQGLGDTLQFCRYASRVADLGASVILEVQRPLRSLLAGLRGVARLAVLGEPLPPFDHHCALMSLPHAFKTTLSTIPAAVPYVAVDAEKSLAWQLRLGPKTRPRVGLVWSGGFRPEKPELWAANARRNIPLSTLAALVTPGIDFYSLQKGEPAESELKQLAASGGEGPVLLDMTAELHDFADTAALIEHLDLVISVDTSTAHLAGALGKPVWILNRFDTCWRWLLDRTDSPWYPTARLYRQPKYGEWDDVIATVRADLARWLEAWDG